MKFISGIGGVILYSDNPKRLVEWYRDCLGLTAESADSECNSVYTTFESWDIDNPKTKQTTAWAILRTDQDIKNKPRTSQINYRVRNMDEILAHLKAQDVSIEKTENYHYGKFAWVKDPDGNQIELWEPSES